MAKYGVVSMVRNNHNNTTWITTRTMIQKNYTEELYRQDEWNGSN